MKVCHVVGAGEFFSEKFNPVENEYIIAADGGYDYCTMLGINPDMVLGDFDSIHSIPMHKHILKYPVKKDDTDMMIAVKKALEEGVVSELRYQNYIDLYEELKERKKRRY